MLSISLVTVLVPVSCFGGIIYLLVDLAREQRGQKAPVKVEPVSRPVYLKDCVYLYPEG